MVGHTRYGGTWQVDKSSDFYHKTMKQGPSIEDADLQIQNMP